MKSVSLVGALFTISLALSATSASAAVDADAATGLAKSNGCMKCHAIDKNKKGPSYKKISEKYKGKADAESAIMKSITTGPKVKLDDGSEDQHKIIDTKDQGKLKNLINWILAQ
ncbi:MULTISPECIES: c-type cytochrome [Oxalobacteraceae]|jgi:cytochrome c|uniref:c-type cytochrome n=1 Tax=Oxalobacteraceae TaxID=75682 RepID=UPI0010A41110|nr:MULTISPECIES: c-type cytochrome [Oxalobacteraceae]